MPVGYIVRENRTKAAELEKRLTEEWKGSGAVPSGEDAGAPVLIEDEQPARIHVDSKPLHLYVIWEEWDGLSHQERSEIIMDSYEATHDVRDVVRVTLAMGLTGAEAGKMGLEYRLGSPPAKSASD
ncbi:MAG: hypothetical protein OHK0029_23210 [Armatimonadaceae bacterium]